jgi:hypothetical protein
LVRLAQVGIGYDQRRGELKGPHAIDHSPVQRCRSHAINDKNFAL